MCRICRFTHDNPSLRRQLLRLQQLELLLLRLEVAVAVVVAVIVGVLIVEIVHAPLIS